VAAGHAVNNPSVAVTFPTDDSNASKAARIQASLVTLQNLKGPGVGCPAASTTLRVSFVRQSASFFSLSFFRLYSRKRLSKFVGSVEVHPMNVRVPFLLLRGGVEKKMDFFGCFRLCRLKSNGMDSSEEWACQFTMRENGKQNPGTRFDGV
jgi:hypothetical protein